MAQRLEIFIDRLKEGKEACIKETLDPRFLAVQEAELQFDQPVEVVGKAYLSEEHLVLQLKAVAYAKMPCSVCNQMIEIKIQLPESFCQAVPLTEIQGAIFDGTELVREALLLELPKYVECKEGNCPERSSIAPYLRPPARSKESTYFPFSDLNS